MDIEPLRSFCLNLPSVTEEVKWGADLVFSVGGKMFCVTGTEPPFHYSFKVPDEAFEEQSVQPGFKPAPYLARAKWVSVTDPSVLGRKEREAMIRQSYDLVVAKLTKKVRADLGL